MAQWDTCLFIVVVSGVFRVLHILNTVVFIVLVGSVGLLVLLCTPAGCNKIALSWDNKDFLS